MTDRLNPRLNAYREDLADIRLEGQVTAERFVDGRSGVVVAPLAPLRRSPSSRAALDTEALMGERLRVFDTLQTEEGVWSWVQLETDGYVGYAPGEAIALVEPDTGSAAAAYRVRVPRTFLFPKPDIKTPPVMGLPMGALVSKTGDSADHNAAYVLVPGGAVVAQHLGPPDDHMGDPVAVAERFVGTPYLWGGKSVLGIDCSGLVQLACQMAGIEAPRDSGDQARSLGTRLAGIEALQRGDLIFWPGHVGLMLDGRRLLHANAFHMMTAIEPLAETIERFSEKGVVVSAVRRLPMLS